MILRVCPIFMQNSPIETHLVSGEEKQGTQEYRCFRFYALVPRSWSALHAMEAAVA
jgi:hypothetical protein